MITKILTILLRQITLTQTMLYDLSWHSQDDRSYWNMKFEQLYKDYFELWEESHDG